MRESLDPLKGVVVDIWRNSQKPKMKPLGSLGFHGTRDLASRKPPILYHIIRKISEKEKKTAILPGHVAPARVTRLLGETVGSASSGNRVKRYKKTWHNSHDTIFSAPDAVFPAYLPRPFAALNLQGGLATW